MLIRWLQKVVYTEHIGALAILRYPADTSFMPVVYLRLLSLK